VVQLAGLFLGQHENPAGSVGKALEQKYLQYLPAVYRRGMRMTSRPPQY
jgi:hypothetical protein